jgi:8-oxo-dGTP pyrophosphatase MutT (NUDIX family)
VEEKTLELPSGHVENGQTPEEAARQELLEETGHVADHFECLGNLWPDTGRLSNRMWGYFAANAIPTCDPKHCPEAGVDLVLYGETVRSLLAEIDFSSALSRAVILEAVVKGHISI